MSRKDPTISELRRLTVTIGEAPTVLMVHVDDIPEIVEAYVKLHHEPGINPHTGGRTVPLKSITCSGFMPCGPYWWLRRDLGVTDPESKSLLPVYFDSDRMEEILFPKRS